MLNLVNPMIFNLKESHKINHSTRLKMHSIRSHKKRNVKPVML
jgi:LysM repeat protein